MRLLKLVFNFYLNASIHVAFSVVAFLRITEAYFEFTSNESLQWFIFFGTITGYNFVKYAGVAKMHHRSLTKDLKMIQVFSFFCFLALTFFMYQIPLKTLCFSMPFVLLTILYAVPFLSGFGKNLREVSYLKILVVAFVWSGFTILIPLIDAGKEISLEIVFLLLQRFLIVIVLILPFDIRDVNYDAISLQTIPRKIGVKKTKKIGLILLIFSLVLEYLISSSAVLKTPFMIFFFMLIIFLMRAKIDQSKYYSSFWVEALPIVWWLILLEFHNF
jgi:4-hydroxybenzoate polyprenyltransferase